VTPEQQRTEWNRSTANLLTEAERKVQLERWQRELDATAYYRRQDVQRWLLWALAP
jgi:hypothetical protein